MPNEPGVGEASTDPDSIPRTSFPGACRWTATWTAPQLNRQWSHCRLPPLCQGPTRPSRSARPRHSASGGDLAPCLPFPISRGSEALALWQDGRQRTASPFPGLWRRSCCLRHVVRRDGLCAAAVTARGHWCSASLARGRQWKTGRSRCGTFCRGWKARAGRAGPSDDAPNGRAVRRAQAGGTAVNAMSSAPLSDASPFPHPCFVGVLRQADGGVYGSDWAHGRAPGARVAKGGCCFGARPWAGSSRSPPALRAPAATHVLLGRLFLWKEVAQRDSIRGLKDSGKRLAWFA